MGGKKKGKMVRRKMGQERKYVEDLKLEARKMVLSGEGRFVISGKMRGKGSCVWDSWGRLAEGPV